MKNDWNKKLINILEEKELNKRFLSILKIFYEYYPSEYVQLYQYSVFNERISGILSYEHPHLQSLAYIHHPIHINPLVHKTILNNEVRFFNDNEFQSSIGAEFVVLKPIHNTIIIPFSLNGIVIAFMTAVNVKIEVTDAALKEIQEFSDSCLQVLQIKSHTQTKDFTDKELNVMQSVANGYSTKEISNMLQIGESTVKYFINNVMQKTKSKNRTEAVSQLFRMNLLH